MLVGTLHYTRAFVTELTEYARQFYLNKLYKLKNEDPASWWKNITSLVQLDSFKSNVDHLRYQSAEIPTDLLPDVINKH